MAAFRSGEVRILVATDVAARGLDVRHVTAVINTSLGMSIENYVHRCGRCGRAGATGIATTFVMDGDDALVPPLVELLDRSRQTVPPELRSLVATLETHATRMASDAAKRSAGGGNAQADDEEGGGAEDERKQMQIANRAKQLAKQQAKRTKERKAR